MSGHERHLLQLLESGTPARFSADAPQLVPTPRHVFNLTCSCVECERVWQVDQ